MKWIKNLATGELYRDKWEASKKLGLCAEHVRRLATGSRTSTNFHLTIWDDGKPEPKNMVKVGKPQYQRTTVDTLCGSCNVYTCSWIQKLEPVEGWDAEPVEANKSYLVQECPLFVENKRDKKFVEI